LRPPAWRAMAAILRTEMRRRLADRSIIISSFVAPAVIAAIIGFAFGAAGSNQVIKIGIAYNQPTTVAQRIVEAGIGGAGLGPQVRLITVSDAATLRHEISDGTLGAGVIIPSGFGSPASFGFPDHPVSPAHSDTEPVEPTPILADTTVSTGHGPPSARLTVIGANSSSVAGQLVQSLASGISSRLYAGTLAVTSADTKSPTSDAELTALVKKATGAAEQPALLDLSALNVGTNHAVIGYYGSSIAIVFLFIGAGLGTRAIAIERTGGTLSRLAAAPVSSTVVVIGKMLAVFVTAIVGLLVLWAETVLLFKATWGNAGGVILMCAAVSLAMCSLSMFLTSLARNEQQAYAASIIVGIVLGIVGGNFFPPGSLPGPLQFISLLTPNGWALVGFGRLALEGVGIGGLVGPLVVLGVISVVFIAGAGVRIRRVVEL
jgi:ABC-2 type transport system permease protein